MVTSAFARGIFASRAFERSGAIAGSTTKSVGGGSTTGLAKAIALTHDKPLFAVNHLEAHALTARLTDATPFPYCLFLASGGHTQILGVRGVGDYLKLGGTVDDEDGIPEFGGFEGGSGDAGTEHELTRIDEAAEIEASTGAEEVAHFGGKLLLALDPFGVRGRRKRIHRLLAELALAAAAHDLAEAVELKRNGAGVK